MEDADNDEAWIKYFCHNIKQFATTRGRISTHSSDISGKIYLDFSKQIKSTVFFLLSLLSSWNFMLM